MNDNFYYNQAKLLLKILPLINKFPDFALKGGTAINFFVRNLPRLSVDIDLTYVPIKERKQSLQDISQNLEKLSQEITARIPDTRITLKRTRDTNTIRALIVNQKGITVKVEPNLVMRGSVFPIEKKQLCKAAEAKFKLAITTNTLALADLYGSKLCAALDRQHPRDLFDVHFLLKNEGITDEIRKAFIVYLISHPRPIVELLNPNPQKIADVYHQEFKGMMFEQASVSDLNHTQNFLIQNVRNMLTEEEKEFLISFKSLEPQWHLSGLNDVEQLPAVKWKLLNLEKMSKAKHQQAVEKLRKYLIWQ